MDASLHWTKLLTIRHGCKPPLDQVTQAAVKLELQAPSLPPRRKMPSQCFEGNDQPEHHSNIEDIFHQIYFETVDTVANCIVEYFSRIDYTMYANCEQVLLIGTLGKLVSQDVDNASSTQFD